MFSCLVWMSIKRPQNLIISYISTSIVIFTSTIYSVTEFPISHEDGSKQDVRNQHNTIMYMIKLIFVKIKDNEARPTCCIAMAYP